MKVENSVREKKLFNQLLPSVCQHLGTIGWTIRTIRTIGLRLLPYYDSTKPFKQILSAKMLEIFTLFKLCTA